MVDYSGSPGYFGSGTRERGRDELSRGEDGCDAKRQSETINVKFTKLEGKGSRGYGMFYSQRRHGRLAQLVRAWC